jgi:hypothetical protein
MNNQCSIVNIVWTDRGILLSIIYYIIKFYSKLIKKTVIINNKRYRKFLRIIFPNLKFVKYQSHSSDNFYFNIRTIIKKQDIIIDYLANYSDNILAEKINLVPWFDMNDPLIIYYFDETESLNAESYRKFVKDFVQCRRGSYNGYIWDSFMEKYILEKYVEFASLPSISTILKTLNDFLASEYTNTVNYYAKVFYKPVMVTGRETPTYKKVEETPIIQQPIKPESKKEEVKMEGEKPENEDKLNELIRLMTNKLDKMYDLIE